MSSKNSNRINVPEARKAMSSMKHEVASELGISLNEGYNGNIAAKDAGHIGGNMVKTVLLERRINIKRKNVKPFTFLVRVAV